MARIWRSGPAVRPLSAAVVAGRVPGPAGSAWARGHAAVPGPIALPAIELAGVVKEFPARGEVVAAVRGIDLQMAEAEFFSLLGPSGCGKTTMMRMVAGFEEPTHGV